MNAISKKTERIHSLDSLRAIMMLLGLVIHSAITFGTYDYGSAWTIKDPSAMHISNDFIVYFIHSFRMQIFFVVAGFFGAMLFYERQPLRMVKNRVARIVFPFIVFLFLLWPTILFCFGFSRAVFAGSPDPLSIALSSISSWDALIPDTTFHLWFLYYLTFITFASVGLGLIMKRLPRLSRSISSGFNYLFTRPILRILAFTCLTCGVYLVMGTFPVKTSTSFVFDLDTFVYYTFFYLVGWILFKSKHLLDEFKRLDWFCTVAGVALFSFYFFMESGLSESVRIILYSTIGWLFIFGISGLFIRYGSNHSARMRYISDSSYWVYLMHLSFTAVIPGLIAEWALPASMKFLFVMTVSATICFVTYHYLVRPTFIGKFLNGRKYSRKLADIREKEKISRLQPSLQNLHTSEV